MYRKEVNAQSPLRILEKSIHGGLGKGNLGVVQAPAGVGKSACLVQIGLDDLMREKDVLHVAIGQTVEHVSAWYDALFDDLAQVVHLEDRGSVRENIAHHRLIKAFAEGAFTRERFDEAIELFEKHLKLEPAAILIDGFAWTAPGCTATLQAVKASAKRVGAELWMTAQTPRGYNVLHPRKITPPCDGCAALIDVGLFLEPHGSHVKLRLVKDFDSQALPEVQLSLHCDTLRLVKEGEASEPRAVPASSFTLLAGGANGAEAEFGACAEKWGLHEVNFSFKDRGAISRRRGLLELSEEELKLGEVSSTYLKAHMHRTYPDTPLFRQVLQVIWHQVNTAGEVFSVGVIQADKTVRGGTGWAVELARHWGKPVYVFDQEKKGWFAWKERDWVAIAPPSITRERFAGTGTRFLSDEGKVAIQGLFERSFRR